MVVPERTAFREDAPVGYRFGVVSLVSADPPEGS